MGWPDACPLPARVVEDPPLADRPADHLVHDPVRGHVAPPPTGTDANPPIAAAIRRALPRPATVAHKHPRKSEVSNRLQLSTREQLGRRHEHEETVGHTREDT